MNYCGRFAPSPSGPLHFGSVIAALGSYLQSKYHHGKWLVRIDDIDTTRSRDSAITQILKQLEQLGLYWDDKIVYQSKRTELYQEALEQLIKQDLVYACECTRKQIGAAPYSGTCREKNLPFSKRHSLRIKTNNETLLLEDKLQDDLQINVQQSQGDFIIKRTDGLFAYHLATVIDDQAQGITEVVRGADLYESTISQCYLQHCLSLERPDYFHLPVAYDEMGKKISKSDGVHNLDMSDPVKIIYQALNFLGQDTPQTETFNKVEELLSYAIEHWCINSIPKQQSIPVKLV